MCLCCIDVLMSPLVIILVIMIQQAIQHTQCKIYFYYNSYTINSILCKVWLISSPRVAWTILYRLKIKMVDNKIDSSVWWTYVAVCVYHLVDIIYRHCLGIIQNIILYLAHGYIFSFSECAHYWKFSMLYFFSLTDACGYITMPSRILTF